MKLCVQLAIIFALIALIFNYFLMPSSSSRINPLLGQGFQPKPQIREYFEGDSKASVSAAALAPGHGHRHPQKDIVSSMINDYLGNPETAGPGAYTDPVTIAKLKRTMDVPKGQGWIESGQMPTETNTKVAYNDVAAYRPGGVHPFNISAKIISQTWATDPVVNADSFHNSYYDLWESDQRRESDLVGKKTEEIVRSKQNCVNFRNVNQCMSVCSGTPNCVGFYIDEPPDGIRPGTCCMEVNPTYAANRHDYTRFPNELSMLGSRTIDKLIDRNKKTAGKLVFDYIRTDKGNGVYKADVTKQQCKNICPKCILGRCPENYRCTNLLSDPRYNHSCLIANEDRYDETKPGLQFDSPAVPYLDVKYQLNEYAAYERGNPPPILTVPETERYYLYDRILPTADELQSAFVAFDENHIGPYTFNSSFDKKYNVQLASQNLDELGTRGGNDPIGIASTHRRGPYYPTHRDVPTAMPSNIPKGR